jgi:CHAD domain-containing protein
VETTEEIIMSSKEKLKELQMLQTILGEIQDLTVLLKLFEDFKLNKGTDVSGFLDFVENIKQKREKKEREFWDKLSCLEYWDKFLMNI